MQALTQIDVERLMKQPSPTARAIIAGKLARDLDGAILTESELVLAQDIIRKLANDAQVVVRRALSDSLRRSKRLPHDVALKLAQDVEAVALPIIADSEVLEDDDLILLLRGASLVKQNAVAARPNVSERVSDVIINTLSEAVVATLINNKSAAISPEGYDKTIERFSSSDLVKECLVKREALPVVVAERLVWLVAHRWQDYLIAHHQLPEPLVAELLEQSRERALIQFSRDTTLDAAQNLTQDMLAHGRLTPTLVTRALCCGNLPFFESSLAALARIPVTNAQTLIHDSGAAGLVSLLTKAGIPPRLEPLIRTALEAHAQLRRDGQDQDVKRFRARIIERLLTQVADLGDEDVDYLLDLTQ